jgi:hypothetical protein
VVTKSEIKRVGYMFNIGFLCLECGPIETAKKSQRNKVTQNTCPTCGGIVKAWERPLNERDGRCRNCGNASFKSAIWKHDILRKCKTCDEVYNIDQETVVRKGKKEHAIK